MQLSAGKDKEMWFVMMRRGTLWVTIGFSLLLTTRNKKLLTHGCAKEGCDAMLQQVVGESSVLRTHCRETMMQIRVRGGMSGQQQQERMHVTERQ